MDDDTPKCHTCAAPITTGFMALICPRRERCEMWNDDCAKWEEAYGPMDSGNHGELDDAT